MARGVKSWASETKCGWRSLSHKVLMAVFRAKPSGKACEVTCIDVSLRCTSKQPALPSPPLPLLFPQVLRVFLEADGNLRSNPQWRALKPNVLTPTQVSTDTACVTVTVAHYTTLHLQCRAAHSTIMNPQRPEPTSRQRWGKGGVVRTAKA